MDKSDSIYSSDSDMEESMKSRTFTYIIKSVLLSREVINGSHTIKTEFHMNVKLYPPTNSSIYVTQPVVVNQEVKASYYEVKDDCYLFFLEKKEKTGEFFVGLGYRIEVTNRLIASFPVKGTAITTKK